MTSGTEDAHREPGRPVTPLIDPSTEAIGAVGGLAGGVCLRSRTPGMLRLSVPAGLPGPLFRPWGRMHVDRPETAGRHLPGTQGMDVGGNGIGALRVALARYGDPASPAPDHSPAAVADRLTARARHAVDRPDDIALLLAVRRPRGPGVRRPAVAWPMRGRRAGTGTPARIRRRLPARGAVRAGSRHGGHAATATAAPVPYRPARAAPRTRGNVSRLPEPGSVDMGTWSG
jgi:hypothetical protein